MHTWKLWVRKSPPPPDEPVILWDSFGALDQHPETISLPIFIEENSHEIRKRILRFLQEAGELKRFDGTPLVEALSTPDGLSLWWMACSIIKRLGDPTIPLIARLIALEMLLGDRGANLAVSLECDDENLKRLLASCITGNQPLTQVWRRRVAVRAFHLLKAGFAILHHLWSTSFQSHGLLDDFRSHQGGAVFFDYFLTGTSDHSGHSRYQSMYWGDVPNLIYSPTWIHVIPTKINRRLIALASKAVGELNRTKNEHHYLYLKKLTIQNLKLVLSNHLIGQRAYRDYSNLLRKFTMSGSKLYLWSVVEDKWADALLGSASINNQLAIVSAGTTAQNSRDISRIYYLMENQPWELALVHQVQLANQTTISGVPHSTIRFWDLRYFNTDLDTKGKTESPIPQPSRILVNSTNAAEALIESGIPSQCVEPVESARYNYLSALTWSPPSGLPSILVLGDFAEHMNTNLTEQIRIALPLIDFRLNFVLKSHPACPFTESQVELIPHITTNEPLSSLFPRSSVVVTTGGSSTSAEALTLGVPTILVLDPTSLDFSPNLSSERLAKVRNPQELARMICTFLSAPATEQISTFIVDPGLTRWRHELSQ